MEPFFPKKGEKFVVNPEVIKFWLKEKVDPRIVKALSLFTPLTPVNVETRRDTYWVQLSTKVGDLEIHSLYCMYPSGSLPGNKDIQMFLRPTYITQDNSIYCSCSNPLIKEVLLGIGPSAETIKVCSICKKENL